MRHAGIPAHFHILGYRASMFRHGSGGALLRLLAEEEHETLQLGCSRGIRLAGSDVLLQQASPPRAGPLGC